MFTSQKIDFDNVRHSFVEKFKRIYKLSLF